jgi:hypothetical protein
MTVFARLEAQLLEAHAHRDRRALPRVASRHVLGAAAAAAAVVVAILIAGSHGSPRIETLRPATTVPAAVRPTSAQGATAPVTVLNATASPGVAGRIATAFSNSGLRIGVVENAPIASATTRVFYRPGGERTAALVASLLKLDGAAPAPRSLRSFSPVVVVAGHDRIHGPIITLGVPPARLRGSARRPGH